MPTLTSNSCARRNAVPLALGLLLALLAPACHRRMTSIPPPPPPNHLALGDEAFLAGDLLAASGHYEQYLDGSSLESGRDRALFRLALAATVPGSPRYDVPRGAAHLAHLLELYPSSPYAPEARLLLDYQTKISALNGQLETARQENRQHLRELDAARETEQLRTEEVERLQSEIDSRERRIQELTRELDRLKRIDMQRRPTTTPR